MWLQAFDTVSSQHIHNYMKKHAKMTRNISDDIDLDKELEVWYMGVLGFSAKSAKYSESVSKF